MPNQVTYIDTFSLQSLEGALDILDLGHPDHLDWRQVRFHYDTFEGRWVHFEVLAKQGGRAPLDLATDIVFRMSLRSSFYLLLDQCGLEPGTIHNGDRTPNSFFVNGSNVPYVSFSAKTNSPITLRTLGAHGRLRMQAEWSKLIDEHSRRRSRGVK